MMGWWNGTGWWDVGVEWNDKEWYGIMELQIGITLNDKIGWNDMK